MLSVTTILHRGCFKTLTIMVLVKKQFWAPLGNEGVNEYFSYPDEQVTSNPYGKIADIT